MAWKKTLSGRETEVCLLVSQGLSNEKISHELNITTHTVKTHLRNIYSKSGLNNRTNLAVEFPKKS
jgi:ATP/maltotriose-dependent transcriptional regulator MalT